MRKPRLVKTLPKSLNEALINTKSFSPTILQKNFSPNNLIKPFKRSPIKKSLIKPLKPAAKTEVSLEKLEIESNTNINLKLNLSIRRGLTGLSINTQKTQMRSSSRPESDLSGTLSRSPLQNGILFLKLEQEAIERPYSPQLSSQIGYKEVPVRERNDFWRKKKLAQYKIAKNITPKCSRSPKRISTAPSPRAQQLKNVSSENVLHIITAYPQSPDILTFTTPEKRPASSILYPSKLTESNTFKRH